MQIANISEAKMILFRTYAEKQRKAYSLIEALKSMNFPLSLEAFDTFLTIHIAKKMSDYLVIFQSCF